MDLDDMKVINDTYGHEFGDLALKTVARILKENCAESDFIMRYGGDEFVVVADGRWKDLKDRILSAVDRASQSSGFPFTLGLSIGAIFTRRGEKRSLEDCMREADALMYQIKTARKVGR